MRCCLPDQRFPRALPLSCCQPPNLSIQDALELQVADIEKAERDKMRSKVENIISHGINCFVNRQLIYNFPEEIFADAGVMAIEHADFDGIERLALVTGEGVSSPSNKSLSSDNTCSSKSC